MSNSGLISLGSLTWVAAVIAVTVVTIIVYRRGARSGSLAAVVLLVAVGAAVAWTKTRNRPTAAGEETVSDRPIEVGGEGYVSSKTCRSCHPHQYASWHASYHRTMTQVATPESVVGRFDDVELEFDRRQYRLVRRGDEFWVHIDEARAPGADDLAVENADSAAKDRIVLNDRKRIVMTTGSHHQQAYWVPSGNSRKVEDLPFAYLIDEKRWVPRHAIFLRPPEMRVEKQPGLWNMSCNRCHATHARPRAGQDEHMDTHVAEFGIACEACHGPGQQHVTANRNPARRFRHYMSDQPDRTIVHPLNLDHRRSSYVCAQCHSVNQFYTEEEEHEWAQRGYRYRPGDDLSKTRMLVRHDRSPDQPRLQGILHYYPQYMEDYFWSDGMIRVSGREFNGLLETPCYQRGRLSCLSCHAMHKSVDDPRPLAEWADDQLKLGMQGNEACLACHERFRTDLEAHTHHLPDSTGSQCYNCHMPHTSYGLLKAMRSHQIDSPRVATSLQTGRPNACNLCHLDKTLEWTAGHLAEWTGEPAPWLTDDEKSISAALLWLVRGDAGQRALIAWSMGWPPAQEASGSDWLAPFLAQLLEDPYDAVRFIAYRSLRELPPYRDFAYDYVGRPEERAAARGQAIEIWRRAQSQTPTQTGPQILIDATGALQLTVLQRLLGERDDRRVNLNE
jgi:hypothetical protein